MKTLYMIGGTMGVGKTTVSQLLNKKLDNAVFLDGDWCWNADPFQITKETKAMVLDNICHLLNSFIHCSAYDNVVFCWVMHEQAIIDKILSNLDLDEYEVKVISLTCSADALAKRIDKDIEAGIRSAEALKRSLNRISLYDEINSIKVDVSNRDPAEIAEFIATQI
ncbi:AAA family ATPase [Lacticigenium naphthae]|uniref:AAA family ATPase n=1 Tax=Lacticigenium naphthae TaxID=515351 RepID=UPI0004871980|nr:AAA family ATPase [Lacticigenium naphthae]